MLHIFFLILSAWHATKCGLLMTMEKPSWDEKHMLYHSVSAYIKFSGKHNKLACLPLKHDMMINVKNSFPFFFTICRYSKILFEYVKLRSLLIEGTV